MTGKVTWNDLLNASANELKKTYKLNDRQLENQMKKHLKGATSEQRSTIYGQVWSNKR